MNYDKPEDAFRNHERVIGFGIVPRPDRIERTEHYLYNKIDYRNKKTNHRENIRDERPFFLRRRSRCGFYARNDEIFLFLRVLRVCLPRRIIPARFILFKRNSVFFRHFSAPLMYFRDSPYYNRTNRLPLNYISFRQTLQAEHTVIK